jgi:hypothetical protein
MLKLDGVALREQPHHVTGNDAASGERHNRAWAVQ